MCCLKLKEQDSKILRSNEIDNIIRADAIKAKRHVKILLLGTYTALLTLLSQSLSG